MKTANSTRTHVPPDTNAPLTPRTAVVRIAKCEPAQRLFDVCAYRILRGRVLGFENIPAGGCILAFNHSSYFDWLLVYHLFTRHYERPVYFLAKAKLRKNPLWDLCLDYAQAIVVDYGHFSTIKSALRTMKEHLDQGHLVGIFPEGTRSPDGQLQKARDGVIWLAEQADVPIVPVGLQGFYQAWPRHRVLPRAAHCTINVGKPIHLETDAGADRKARRKQLKTLLMERIGAMLEPCCERVDAP